MFQTFRSELQEQLQGNLKQIEVQINDIKHKQETLSNKDQRNERQQKELADSLVKPAEMLDDLRGQWEKMPGEQTENLKDLVNSQVTEALSKRKEQLKYKKEL